MFLYFPITCTPSRAVTFQMSEFPMKSELPTLTYPWGGRGTMAIYLSRWVLGYNSLWNDRSHLTQSRLLQGDTGPHVQWTPVLLSEALLAHDVCVCLERPSGALPPEGGCITWIWRRKTSDSIPRTIGSTFWCLHTGGPGVKTSIYRSPYNEKSRARLGALSGACTTGARS